MAGKIVSLETWIKQLTLTQQEAMMMLTDVQAKLAGTNAAVAKAVAEVHMSEDETLQLISETYQQALPFYENCRNERLLRIESEAQKMSEDYIASQGVTDPVP